MASPDPSPTSHDGRRDLAGVTSASDPHLPPLHALAITEQRWRNMAAGIERFDRWLEDQVAFGLAGLEADPRGGLEPVAARLTDDQLPSPASALRGWIPQIGMEPDWAVGFGRALGYWHLLNRMALQPARLDAETFAGLALAYGYRLGKAKLPELGRGVEDDWTCVGVVEGNDQQLFYRRTHWRGTAPDRALTQNTYSYGGPPPAAQLGVGAYGRLALLAYPGSLPGRAVLPEGARLQDTGAVGPSILPHYFPTWRAQAAAHVTLARRQPWRRSYPVAVGPLRATVVAQRLGGYTLVLTDSEGRGVALPLRDSSSLGGTHEESGAQLLSIVGAEAFVLFGHRAGAELRPWSVLSGGRLYGL